MTTLPTHNHPDGIARAQATAGAVYLALHGATKDEIKAYVEKFCKIDFTLDEIRLTYRFGRFEALCAGTVPYAVEAFCGVPEKHYSEVIARLRIAGDNLYPILRRLDMPEWPKN